MRLINLSEVLQKTSCSASHVRLLLSAGQFPSPVVLGVRKRAWLAAEIDQWVAEHVAARPACLPAIYIEPVPA